METDNVHVAIDPSTGTVTQFTVLPNFETSMNSRYQQGLTLTATAIDLTVVIASARARLWCVVINIACWRVAGPP